jgi:prevent-host-death family protein
MKTISVGEFKARLAEILERVSKGEEFVVSFGKKRMNVAALIPFKNYKKSKKRKIGLYDGKVKYMISEDFKMTAEEFIGK